MGKTRVEVTIPSGQIQSFKHKRGIYAVSHVKPTSNKVSIDDVHRELKKYVEAICERSFREFARAHKGMTPELENREWNGYLKFLRRYM